MINFLPPAGMPQAADAGDARARREPGRDFAEWLLQTPQQQADAAVPTEPQASEPASAAEVQAAPAHEQQFSAPTVAEIVASATPQRSTVVAERIVPAPQHAPVDPAVEIHRPHLDRDFVESLQAAELPHALESMPHRPEPPEGMPAWPAPTPGAHERPTLAEDVLLPWRLQANAGLSYLGAGAWNPAAAQAASEAAAVPVNTAGTPASTPSTTLALEPHGEWSRPEFEIGAWPHQFPDAAAREARREERLARMEQWLAEHPDWPERLLRWFGNDADITAWVRDFQLGESDLATLVHKLREYAQEHGRPLARVMHNGREVWRARNPNNNENGSES